MSSFNINSGHIRTAMLLFSFFLCREYVSENGLGEVQAGSVQSLYSGQSKRMLFKALSYKPRPQIFGTGLDNNKPRPQIFGTGLANNQTL